MDSAPAAVVGRPATGIGRAVDRGYGQARAGGFPWILHKPRRAPSPRATGAARQSSTAAHTSMEHRRWTLQWIVRRKAAAHWGYGLAFALNHSGKGSATNQSVSQNRPGLR